MDGLDPKTKSAKRISQRERILALLQAKGHAGATSEELNNIAFRYSSVIHGLRALGYDIETRNRIGTELARFILWRGPGEVLQTELCFSEGQP